MKLCIMGTSLAARKLYDCASASGTFDPCGFIRFDALDMDFYYYTDDPGGEPLPARLFSLSDASAQVNNHHWDGVCIPDDNYLQIRIAMVNQLRSVGVKKIFFAGITEDKGVSLTPFGLSEKITHTKKEILRIAIYIQHVSSHNGAYLRNLIEESYTNVVVSCFTANRAGLDGKVLDSLPVITLEKAAGLCENQELDGILFIQKPNGLENQMAMKLLRDRGITGIYMAPGKIFDYPSPLSRWLEEMLEIFDLPCQIGIVNINVTDHCNLNCSACNHFSSLLDSRTKDLFWEYDMDTFKSDINALNRILGDDISQLFLLGGEPFLHSDFEEFMRYARKVFPYTEIGINTNGLLLPHLTGKLLQTIRECQINIRVTAYPMNKVLIESIKNVLDAKSIFYCIGDQIEKFMGMLRLQGDCDPQRTFDICWDKYCHSVRKGKFAVCPTIQLIDKFNVYFEQSIPFSPDSGIDLNDDSVTKEEVIKYLQVPDEICRYCDRGNMSWPDWSMVSGRADINNWLASECAAGDGGWKN